MLYGVEVLLLHDDNECVELLMYRFPLLINASGQLGRRAYAVQILSGQLQTATLLHVMPHIFELVPLSRK